jgi:hypothetical protein
LDGGDARALEGMVRRAMKKKMLAYIAPAGLLYSWPELASKAGFHVEVDPKPYVVIVPGLPGAEPVTCRSGTVRRGDVFVRVCPSAGSHAASKSPVAGKLVLLVFYSAGGRHKEPIACESGLAYEFGDLLIRAGATPVR